MKKFKYSEITPENIYKKRREIIYKICDKLNLEYRNDSVAHVEALLDAERVRRRSTMIEDQARVMKGMRDLSHRRRVHNAAILIQSRWRAARARMQCAEMKCVFCCISRWGRKR